MRCGSARCRSSSEQMGCSRAKVRCRSASRLVVAGGADAAPEAAADATVKVDGSSSMREAAASEGSSAGQGSTAWSPVSWRATAGTHTADSTGRRAGLSEHPGGVVALQLAAIHRYSSE
jgi:hypothetical protein